MSPFESELREFIRRLRLGEDAAYAAARRVRALSQATRDAWTEVGGPKLCLTRLTGEVRGIKGLPMANTEMLVTGHTSLIDYGTVSTPAGTFTDVALVLDAADVQLDLAGNKTSGPTWRFRSTPVSVATSVSRCNPNTVNISMQPDSSVPGTRAADKLSNYPIKSVLKVDDTRRGLTGVSITCPSGGNVWTGTSGAVTYTLTGGGSGGPALTVTNGNFTGPPFSIAEPDEAGTLFQTVWHAAVTFGTYTAGDAITIYEV